MRKLVLSSLADPATFPHPIKQNAISMPRSLFYLSTSSIVISFILLIVSLLDLGYFSLWLTPPVSLVTLMYFAGVLILSRMERTEEDPTYFSTVVLVGYFITLIWLVAFILTIIVFAAYPHIVEALHQQGLHTVTVGLQRFECILCITNLGLVGGFTARSHIIAMVDGEPENWRILVEKNSNPAANRQIRVQRPVTMNDPSMMIQEPRAAPTPLPEPEMVTASILEEKEREGRNVLKLEIQVSPPPTEDGFYLSDYYEEESQGGAFSAISHDHQFDRVVYSPNPDDVGKEYCDGDSMYYGESELPDSPDKWSQADEEDVKEEYKVDEGEAVEKCEEVEKQCEVKKEHEEEKQEAEDKADFEHPR
jgi:hypothetical protein